jgi:hypothetical protein
MLLVVGSLFAILRHPGGRGEARFGPGASGLARPGVEVTDNPARQRKVMHPYVGFLSSIWISRSRE